MPLHPENAFIDAHRVPPSGLSAKPLMAPASPS